MKLLIGGAGSTYGIGRLEHRLLLSWNAEDVVISCESSGNHIVCPWTEQTAFKASREWLEALKR